MQRLSRCVQRCRGGADTDIEVLLQRCRGADAKVLRWCRGSAEVIVQVQSRCKGTEVVQSR